MITKGGRVPTDLQLKVVQDDGERLVALSELLTRPTIVSVYMKNNTPSCDRQNESLAQAAQEFSERGYNLVALSRDTCGSHRRYAQKKGISYALASDPGDTFAKATDSVVEKSMYGRTFTGPVRAAYILDREGTVLAVIPKVDTSDHAAQLRTVLEDLS